MLHIFFFRPLNTVIPTITISFFLTIFLSFTNSHSSTPPVQVPENEQSVLNLSTPENTVLLYYDGYLKKNNKTVTKALGGRESDDVSSNSIKNVRLLSSEKITSGGISVKGEDILIDDVLIRVEVCQVNDKTYEALHFMRENEAGEWVCVVLER